MLERKSSLLSRIVKRIIVWIYKYHGWKAIGEAPKDKRFIIVAAPHTSNWDFLYFIGLTNELGIQPHFMAKESLFRWPWKNFLLDMGGVPIDRSGGKDIVASMVEEFSKRKEFMLTIAPEGTRSSVQQWKTGFYHIARKANVPIVIGMMDYGNKTGGLLQSFMTTGDYKNDMKVVEKNYKSVTPKHPDKAMKSIVDTKL